MAEAEIRALFREQAASCRALGSPFTARVLTILALDIAAETPLGQALFSLPPRRDDALPIRLAGGLHALARAGDALALAYPPHEVDDPTLRAALLKALANPALLPWLKQAPQTNEVARSSVLIATGHWLTARFGLPLVLSELGASAGLNLLWDHYALNLPGRTLGPATPALRLTPDWQGPLPPMAPPRITARAGVDLAPLDPARDRNRLLAYVWPDQTTRLARAEAALTLAARLRPEVTQADAAPWLEARLAEAHPGHLHLVFHTVAAQYFPPETQTRVTRALAQAGARATAQAPLAHLQMEGDGKTPDAVLTLTLWPGGQVIPLGRADFHGRHIAWAAPDAP